MNIIKQALYLCVSFALFVSITTPRAAQSDETDDKASLDQLVADTHAASLKLREKSLRGIIAKDTFWPGGVWGENMWCLAALYLNEKTDLANARLLHHAKAFIDTKPDDSSTMPDDPTTIPDDPTTKPDDATTKKKVPWAFFSLPDYVRTLCLFHSKSPDFPGRLKLETEAAMKEALWRWVHHESRIAATGTNNLLLLQGTENHDLVLRPACYLVTALLQDDPAYRDRKLRDGHTVAEHAAAYTDFYREWPGKRAGTGLWIEIGAGYQKYSWPGLFNLCELSPDPLIRKRFSLLLDLAFVEEEQICVHGRRGGGMSRAHPGGNEFESYKNLFYAQKGRPAFSTVSRVMETSRYQLPPEAIYLRYRAFPADKPFVIRNRVLGGLGGRNAKEVTLPAWFQMHAADSPLINYAYRTPHYLLGGTLQNPNYPYSAISMQNRMCGMLFEGPGICSVHSVAEQGRGGRPQHPFWSVQHENVLILQRIAPGPRHGSYSTGKVGLGFTGKALKKVETKGWIFASNDQAFVGVKFLDGAYQWDEKGEVATPADFKPAKDQSRILLVAGDINADNSYEDFQAAMLASQKRLRVTPEKVEYEFGPARNRIEMTAFDPKAADTFTLPRINGQPVDLHPATAYQSPYLNSAFGSEKITVTVGPINRVLDFQAP